MGLANPPDYKRSHKFCTLFYISFDSMLYSLFKFNYLNISGHVAEAIVPNGATLWEG
jgi:hypothetical protein